MKLLLKTEIESPAKGKHTTPTPCEASSVEVDICTNKSGKKP
jgi:hypothetical protein